MSDDKPKVEITTYADGRAAIIVAGWPIEDCGGAEVLHRYRCHDDLLDALRECLQWIEVGSAPTPAVKAAHAAIAKATGGTPR